MKKSGNKMHTPGSSIARCWNCTCLAGKTHDANSYSELAKYICAYSKYVTVWVSCLGNDYPIIGTFPADISRTTLAFTS